MKSCKQTYAKQFKYEKDEHPTLSDKSVCTIVKDHMKKKRK